MASVIFGDQTLHKQSINNFSESETVTMRLRLITELKTSTHGIVAAILEFCESVWSWNTKLQISDRKKLFGDAKLLVAKLCEEAGAQLAIVETEIIKMCEMVVHYDHTRDINAPEHYVLEHEEN